MDDKKEQLNYFLVKVFNEILKIEEDCLSKGKFKDLSIREMHIIESVCEVNNSGMDNRASIIAQERHITAGTLTTTVSLLEKKGYLVRKQDEKDKRVIRIYPTEKGIKANELHTKFHKEMVEDIMNVLDLNQAEVFIRGLAAIKKFFDSKYLK